MKLKYKYFFVVTCFIYLLSYIDNQKILFSYFSIFDKIMSYTFHLAFVLLFQLRKYLLVVFPFFSLLFFLLLVLSSSPVYAKDIIIIIIPRERTRESHFRIVKELFLSTYYFNSLLFYYISRIDTIKKV